MHLGSKGFFTIIFIIFEDKNRVLDDDPYFFYSVGIFLRPWREYFNPKKENMQTAPVWIRMYSSPWEYLDVEISEDVGKTLSQFIKILEQMKEKIYMDYAHICVYMDVTKALPKAIDISWDNEKWRKSLIYE